MNAAFSCRFLVVEVNAMQRAMLLPCSFDCLFIVCMASAGVIRKLFIKAL